MPSPSAHALYAGAIGAGIAAVGMYACVLYQRKLQLQKQQMYIDALVRAMELAARVRRGPAR